MRVNKSYHRKNHLKRYYIFTLLVLFFINQVNAQFTFKDDFKKSTAPDVVIGGIGGANGTAYLTSGIDDPLGAGWLRLTKATTNQGGYAYVNKSFPSTLGIVMDFEYKMWRNVPDSFNGADGIGVFLFDAADVEANGFRLGAYGGALGYTSNTDEGIVNGLRGGYIGIGFDALGNYANTIFGPKNGGPGLRPNAVSLRGPTNDSNLSQSNVFLTGVTILNGHNIVDINSNTGSFTDNEIDYNTVVSSRPEDNIFYRRIQIEMQPVSGGYHITVRWKTDLNSAFVQLLDYTTLVPPPELLSVGFAASTGLGVNLHEVRNLTLTTPGNLRITKQADKSYLRAITTSGLNQITYYIDVVNDTPASLQNVNFTDQLTDGNGNLIAPSMFTITSISHTGFLSGTNLPVTSAVNQFSGTLNMAANSTGRIIISGELAPNQIPASNLLTNVTNVSSTDITDEDLGNNTAEITVPVLAEDVDLVPIEEGNNFCVTGANQFKLRVANIGSTPATYRRIGTTGRRIVVTKIIPAGFNYDDSATPGGFDNAGGATARWSRFVTPDSPSTGQTTYSYVARFPIDDSDQTLAGLGTVYQTDYPITYSITPPVGTTSYINSATVSYTDICAVDPDNCYTGNNLEFLTPTDNTANNTISETLQTEPGLPTAVTAVEYCQDAPAIALTATADSGNTLLWYTALNGSSSTIAPVPLTDQPGIFEYYVSQENGSCEGPKTHITVTILDLPTSGGITTSQTICNGQLPNLINSASSGTGINITYRWEVSTDGISWTTIPGETNSFYQPPVQTETHQYRRISQSNYPGGTICESAATSPAVITAQDCKVVSNPMVRQRVK